MELSDRKEQFSFAYLHAVASVAGFGIHGTWPAPDRNSIDMTVSGNGAGGTVKSPIMQVQLKCTAAPVPNGTHISYPLKLKNYNDLRVGREKIMVPHILLVVFVPDDAVESWLEQSEEKLSMRHCGYWLSLRDMREVENTSSVTIHLPRSNLFTVDALSSIMQGIGNGVWP